MKNENDSTTDTRNKRILLSASFSDWKSIKRRLL